MVLDPRFRAARVFMETPDKEIIYYLRDIWTGRLIAADERKRILQDRLLKSWVPDGDGVDLDINGTHVIFRFHRLDGQYVCFFEPTSNIVNWGDVRDWIKMNVPDVTIVDSTNFNAVLAAVKK